ncbi:helix-turn-helix domain-containing protein [Paenibacillus marinisediminis]
MNLKEARQLTGLSEHTIRFYVENGLIHPKIEIQNGREYQEYSEQDVENLKAIMTLRKMLFSIADIQDMQQHPEKIEDVCYKHCCALNEEVALRQKILAVHDRLDYSMVSDIHTLAMNFTGEVEDMPLPVTDMEPNLGRDQNIGIGPNFGKFDPETEEEKADAYMKFRVKQAKEDSINDRVQIFWRPMKWILAALLSIGLVMSVLIGISAIPETIHAEYPAVQYRANDASYMERTKIKVDGKLYTRWFSDPRFKGTFVIEQYPYTKEYQLVNIVFYDDIRNGWGYLIYSSFSNGRPILESLGSIWIDKHMGKINIQVFEPISGDAKTTKDLIISAPAETREEAIAITEQLSKYGTPME